MKKILPPVFILLIMAMVFILAMALNPASTYEEPKKDPVDLNNASQKELESLRGIGPATANRIIESRPYKSVHELSRAGLSAVIINKYLEPYVTVGPAALPAGAVKPSKVAEAPEKATPAKEEARMETAEKVKAAEKSGLNQAPGQKVTVSPARQEQPDALPEIGPAKAQAII